jgi:hypothetical protein
MAEEFTAQLPPCVHCHQAIDMENAWIDDRGKAIHAKCYLLKLKQEQATAPPYEN